jgi:hypothetical protein
MKSPDRQFIETLGLMALSTPIFAALLVLMPIYFCAHCVRILFEEIKKANNEPNKTPWN